MNVIKNPLTSVSELKKAPMKIIELSKESGDAVYILNNNKDVGVIVASDRYKELIESNAVLEEKNNELTQRLVYLETELRLLTNKKTFLDSEIRESGGMHMDLSELDDEWE
ncbi:hypothetical protein IGI44_004236 [Enterococcus sp. DIV0756]